MRGKPRLDKLRGKDGELLSDNWYIFYFERGHTRRQTTGCRIGTEDDAAQTFFHTWCLERERPVAREPDKLMIAQALRDYITEHAEYTATPKHAKYHETRLNAFFGDRTAGDITQGRINEYVRSREAKGESNGTIRRDLETLKAALNHEERERRLVYVPKFKMPPPPLPRDGTLSRKEIESIKAAAKSQHIKDFIDLMYETGQRPGAIERLKWFQVDFKKGLIGFDLTGRKQSNKRVRPVAMSAKAKIILKRLFKVKVTEYVLEYLDPITKTIKPAGCVKKAFQRACKAAGVKTYRYALRKTFANRDIDELIKQQVMGHTNIKTTREHYIQVNIERQREALEQPKNSPRGKKNAG